MTGPQHAKIKELILEQNATVHCSCVSGDPSKTHEDEIWDFKDDDRFREYAPDDPYSAAWHLWHSARIEDICSHYFISGTEQVFERKKYQKRMKCGFTTTGNEFDDAHMKRFNSEIDLRELRNYRVDVGKETRRIIEKMDPQILTSKVDPKTLGKIMDGGNIGESSEWLLAFWGKKRISGIIAMPLTRHILVHLNETRKKLKLR